MAINLICDVCKYRSGGWSADGPSAPSVRLELRLGPKQIADITREPLPSGVENVWLLIESFWFGFSDVITGKVDLSGRS